MQFSQALGPAYYCHSIFPLISKAMMNVYPLEFVFSNCRSTRTDGILTQFTFEWNGMECVCAHLHTNLWREASTFFVRFRWGTIFFADMTLMYRSVSNAQNAKHKRNILISVQQPQHNKKIDFIEIKEHIKCILNRRKWWLICGLP